MDKSDVSIAFKVFSPQDSRNAPIILLHGVTSSKESWDDCGQEIADRTSSKVYALDARNHGDSGRAEAMDYDVMTDDVVRFMDSQTIPKAIIVGHSMGGKTGMCFALKYPQRLESLIIEDISAHSPPGSITGVDYYMQQLNGVLAKIPLGTDLEKAKRLAASYLTGGESAAKKKQEESILVPKIWDGKDLPLKQTPGGGFEWKTNLDAIMESRDKGKWKPLSSDGCYEGPVLSIFGTKSPFKVLDDKEEFLKQFPRTLYQPLEGGSHLLHLEYPKMFTNIVCDFILQQRTSSTN